MSRWEYGDQRSAVYPRLVEPVRPMGGSRESRVGVGECVSLFHQGEFQGSSTTQWSLRAQLLNQSGHHLRPILQHPIWRLRPYRVLEWHRPAFRQLPAPDLQLDVRLGRGDVGGRSSIRQRSQYGPVVWGEEGPLYHQRRDEGVGL